VCINGEHIKGSPNSVLASRNYCSLSKPIKIMNNDGAMGEPGGSRNGKWAVADTLSLCIPI